MKESHGQELKTEKQEIPPGADTLAGRKRILLVDDHALVRCGLKDTLMDEIKNIDVIEASMGQEAIAIVSSDRPDAVILDISLPGRSGIDVLKDLKSIHHDIPILILSMYSENQFAVRAMRDGASGYLTKQASPRELAHAVRQLLAGRKYVSESVAEQLISQVGAVGAQPDHAKLSDREYEILRYIAQGISVSGIAARLCLSVKTISTYRERLLQKMRLKNNAELMRYAMEHGLTE